MPPVLRDAQQLVSRYFGVTRTCDTVVINTQTMRVIYRGAVDDQFVEGAKKPRPTANYLRDAGWKRNLPWGVPVSVPANLNRAAIRSAIKPPRCPAVYNRHSRWLTVREWRAMGIRPADSRVPDNEMAALMETPGAYAQGYLLTTNYRSILDYNCSNYYALTIGLLADAISRR
jgi:hypothetical protein